MRSGTSLADGFRPVERLLASIAIALVGTLTFSPPAHSAGSVEPDRIWFAPGPGTLDFQRLFEHPEEWPRTRRLVRVFKFYAQHTQTPPPPNVGANTYDALLSVDAFRKVRSWGMKTALEIGSVKEFFCTPDESGMDASIQTTLNSIQAIEAGGGSLSYIAMDEPWVAGRSKKCGGPALEPTADRVAVYISAVHQARPQIHIGLIEAYPFSSADAIEQMLQLLGDRGVPPAFLHMDVDWHALSGDAFSRDMRRLKAVCDSRHIPFGIIVVGYNGDADSLYAVDASGITDLIVDTFQTWDAMPEHIIFQSWVASRTGLLITPSNLPEGQLYTHTNLVWLLSRMMRATLGGTEGRALPRPGV
jgi:hypothetical protein